MNSIGSISTEQVTRRDPRFDNLGGKKKSGPLVEVNTTAPPPAAPSLNKKPKLVDLSELIALVSKSNDKNAEEDAEASAKRVEADRQEQIKLGDKRAAQLKEIRDKEDEARELASEDDSLGWKNAIIGLVLAVAGAVVLAAVMVAMPAGAPVSGYAVAGAAMGVYQAAAQVAALAERDANGGPGSGVAVKSYDIGGLVNQVIDAVVDMKGTVEVFQNADGDWVEKANPSRVVNKERAEDPLKYLSTDEISKFKSDVGIAVSVLMAYIMLRGAVETMGMAKMAAPAAGAGAANGGAGSVRGAKAIMDGAATTSKFSTLQTYGAGAMTAAELASAAIDITRGVWGIELAEKTAEISKQQVETEFMQEQIRQVTMAVNRTIDYMSGRIDALTGSKVAGSDLQKLQAELEDSLVKAMAKKA